MESIFEDPSYTVPGENRREQREGKWRWQMTRCLWNVRIKVGKDEAFNFENHNSSTLQSTFHVLGRVIGRE